MFSSINKNVLFGFVGLLLAIQVFNANSLDPKLEQCRQKFLEQAKQINFTSLPPCFDASKLDEAKNHTQIFGKFFDTIPQECKQPTMSNVKECLKYIFGYFHDHSDEFQASIVGSINALFAGSKGCIDQLVKQFSGLDSYIANGCTDPGEGSS